MKLLAWRERRSDVAETLFADHGPVLRAYVRRLVRDDDVAEDIVQETMIRAWKDRSTRDRDHDHQRAWLKVVARNLVIDRHRSAYSRHEAVSDDPSTHVEVRTSATFDEASLDRQLVAEALSELSPAHREVIVRAYYGDHPVAGIAADLGIPTGTVKSRLHHGMRALRASLAEKGVEPS